MSFFRLVQRLPVVERPLQLVAIDLITLIPLDYGLTARYVLTTEDHHIRRAKLVSIRTKESS